MDPLHREVSRFLREHDVGREARILVAVSGGGDSVALLHALLGIGQRVSAAHVHHGLRGDPAEADLTFVAALAHSVGVSFFSARVDAAARDGRSPEARARALRYRALERIRSAQGIPHLATAHQLDDQAETVLLRAARGTGIAGLAAIRPSLDSGRVLRPLIRVRRAELRRSLARRGLEFRDDETNANLATPRNRLRAEILPALEEIHPGASERLASLAGLAAEYDAALVAALGLPVSSLVEANDGGMWVDSARLAVLDAGLRRRMLVEIAARAGLGTEVSRSLVERIDEFLARSAGGRLLSLPNGFSLFRDRTRFWLGPSPGPRFPGPLRVELPSEGGVEFPERGLRLSWHATAAPDRPGVLLRLPARPTVGLIARAPGRSDRVLARGRERRLKDLFATARWSREAQARAVLVERNGEIVWVPGLVRSDSWQGGESPLELRATRLPSARRSC